MTRKKIPLKLQEQLPYYCNPANWGFNELQKREGGGYTIGLKKSFQAFLAENPLQKEVAELFISLQNAQAFRRQIIMAEAMDFKALAERLADICYKCLKRAVYIDAVQRGYVVIDEATNQVIAGVFSTLDQIDEWLVGLEKDAENTTF